MGHAGERRGGAAPDVAVLVEQHYEVLYRYAYRLSGCAADAEDLTQQTFLQAQMKLHQLREPSTARGWLLAILRNLYRRQRRLLLPITLPEVEPTVLAGGENGSAANEEIDSQQLQQALNEMPEAFRTPMILFYFEEFSYRQIAAQLGVPIGTVMSRLARAKAYLRRRLGVEPAARPQTMSVRRDPDGL